MEGVLVGVAGCGGAKWLGALVCNDGMRPIVCCKRVLGRWAVLT